MNELVAEDWKKILLNLRQVTIIDSSGIGEVVSSWKLAKRFGGTVKLLRPAPQVQRTLLLTQLLPLLEIFDDEAEAVASFATT
jgi:anti-sigma B factor antagonist